MEMMVLDLFPGFKDKFTRALLAKITIVEDALTEVTCIVSAGRRSEFLILA